jgi:hypothetical protein
MCEREFKICLEGKIMAGETINIGVTVNPEPQPFTVEDANGNLVSDGGSITLNAETVGVNDPGQTVVSISGGTQPYTASLANGSSAPDGMELTLDETGTIVQLEGTPTTAGDDSFSVTVQDSAGASVTASARSKKKKIS